MVNPPNLETHKPDTEKPHVSYISYKVYMGKTVIVCTHEMSSILESSICVWSPCACVPYSGKVWRIDSFRAYGERKFGELIDQPVGYQL